MIEATALSDTADHDVILVGTRDLSGDGNFGVNRIHTIDYSNRQSLEVTVNGNLRYEAQAPRSVGSFFLGQVDRNRDTGRVDLEDAVPLDFTIVDYDGDGAADVIAITGDTAGLG